MVHLGAGMGGIGLGQRADIARRFGRPMRHRLALGIDQIHPRPLRTAAIARQIPAARPVFAQRLKPARLAVHHLHHAAARPLQGQGQRELLMHGFVLKRLHPATAKDAPVEPHGQKRHIGGAGADQLLNPPAALVDHQELIDIADQRPIGAAHRLVLRGGGQFLMRDPLARRHIMAQMMHPARRLQRIQQFGRAVGAIVGHHHHIGEPQHAVPGHPFHNEGPFVPHRGNHCNAQTLLRSFGPSDPGRGAKSSWANDRRRGLAKRRWAWDSR